MRFALLPCFLVAAADGLTFRDVNVLATTDMHSWVAGGDRQVPAGTPALDASLGDLVSFTERARADAAKLGKDVFLVDNGDVIDGTGISNTAADHCAHLLPLLQQVPYDALNCGNHELYDAATTEHMVASGYIDSWKGRYLTSNLVNASTGRPLGSRSRVMVGPRSGVRLLVLGFMYEMTAADGRCAAVDVVPVNDTVRAPWFVDALRSSRADAVLVLAHVDAKDAMLHTITDAVRDELGPAAPVLVIAGHSHVRQNVTIDARAAAYEPGNYYNTIGFASFDVPAARSQLRPVAPVDFQFISLDTSRARLAREVGAASAAVLATADGAAVSASIEAARQSLNLTRVLGCAKQTYLQGGSLDALVTSRVVPEALFLPPRNASQWFIQNTVGLRYDVYEGNVTADDVYKVLPFRDPIHVVRGMRGAALRALLAQLNQATAAAQIDGAGGSAAAAAIGRWQSPFAFGKGPQPNPTPVGSFITTDAAPDANGTFDVLMLHFDMPGIVQHLANITGTNVTADVYRPGFSNTDMMMEWLQASTTCV